jgi:hypothetical protein
MTVGELRELLDNAPEDMPVIVEVWCDLQPSLRCTDIDVTTTVSTFRENECVIRVEK